MPMVTHPAAAAAAAAASGGGRQGGPQDGDALLLCSMVRSHATPTSGHLAWGFGGFGAPGLWGFGVLGFRVSFF